MLLRIWVIVALLVASLGAQIIPGEYMLELEGEPLAGFTAAVKRTEGEERAAERVGWHAARLRAQQEGLKALLAQRGVAVTGSLDTVGNALFVANAREEQLQGLPGVVRVRPVRELKKYLYTAIRLMRVNETWGALGGARNAGAGMKIGVVDTGIDRAHAGFDAAGLTPPDGFPLASPDSNREFTNAKVIAARSYGPNASDRDGHGTGVAMAAAGVVHEAARGVMSGAAPGALLGNYNATSGSGVLSTANALRAIEDAVKDRMDIINLSLGQNGISPAENSDFRNAIAQALAAGVLVVAAAGNEGPDLATIGDPGLLPKVITVGASPNETIPTAAFVQVGETRLPASAASNSTQAAPVQAPLFDIGRIDETRRACSPIPARRLEGRIAVVQRGDCLFADKFTNVQRAGATAIVVYNNAGATERVVMSVDDHPLPGVFLSENDGARLRQLLEAEPDAEGRVGFGTPIPDDPNRVESFSSRGPTPDLLVKPDLLAVGGNVFTAISSAAVPGAQPGASLYVLADGTSLSSPLVAGAAAILKQARPGLTLDQYRSLLINTATALPRMAVQESGAGLMNLPAAMKAMAASDPVSVSFGEVRPNSPAEREFTITNLGESPETYAVRILSNDGLRPSLSAETLAIGAKESARFRLRWDHAEAPAGAYQGMVEVEAAGGTVLHMPYWLAVRGGKPDSISWTFLTPSQPRPNQVVTIGFRVLDVSMLSLDEIQPQVTVVSGGGSVVDGPESRPLDYPGMFFVRVRMGSQAGVNEILIKAGETLERTLRIRASN